MNAAMPVPCIPLRHRLRDVGSLVVEVYTTGNREGWRRTSLLLLTCSLFSLFLSSLLLLYLLYTLGYETVVAGGIAGFVWTLLTVAFFLSKQVRCAGILFVISCLMKKSRKLLLTAGITFVVLRSVQNTLENLTGLFRSMICNLQAKRAAINLTPLDKYIKMLKWVGEILKGASDFGVVNFHSQLKVSPRVDSERFREKLVDAQQSLSETIKFVQSVVDTMSSVSHRMFPVLSFLLLLAFMARHIKRYRNNMKYENVFISSKFICFDEKQKAEGKPHVLPLTPKEAKLYIYIPSPRLTPKEGKAMLKFGVPVFTHLMAWAIFIAVDILMYCFVDIVTTHLSELEPFKVPLIMNVTGTKALIGIPIAEENRSRDFSYYVTLFEKKCLPKPKLLLYDSMVPLTVVLTALFLMALTAAKLTQLRLMVCEQFFSSSAEDRVEHLHARILRRRSKTKEAGAEESSLRSLIFKPSFWCPLLFKPKEDNQNML